MREAVPPASSVRTGWSPGDVPSPGCAVLSPEETEQVLGELTKILAHYNFRSLAQPNASE